MTFYSLGIVGHPLGHTLSPRLHKIFLDAASEQGGTYDTFDIPEHEFGNWISTIQPHLLHGFNVTIPYKATAMRYLIEMTRKAQLIGAVNTVIVKEGGLYGDNTDAYGFAASLSSHRKSLMAGSHALILGVGGSARAVAYALMEMGIRHITFWGRDAQKAHATMKTAGVMATDQGYQTTFDSGDTIADTTLEKATIVVNTTPLGMSPNVSESPLTKYQIAKLPGGALVYDLIYNPIDTKLLKDASTLGLATQGGLDMLIHQGAKSFEIWTQTMLMQDVLAHARDELCL